MVDRLFLPGDQLVGHHRIIDRDDPCARQAAPGGQIVGHAVGHRDDRVGPAVGAPDQTRQKQGGPAALQMAAAERIPLGDDDARVDPGKAPRQQRFEVHVRGRGVQRERAARFERRRERSEIAKRRRRLRRQRDAAENRAEVPWIAAQREHAGRPDGGRWIEGGHLDLRRQLVMQSAARAADQQLDRVTARRQGASEDERVLLHPAALEIVEVEGERPLTRHEPRPSMHAHYHGSGAKMVPLRIRAQA